MTLIRRTALSLLVGCLLGLVAAPLAMSLAAMSPTPPVVKVKNSNFGNILQSKNRLPLYYWSMRSVPAARSAAPESARAFGLRSSSNPERRCLPDCPG
jgi:hypothetical protein